MTEIALTFKTKTRLNSIRFVRKAQPRKPRKVVIKKNI